MHKYIDYATKLMIRAIVVKPLKYYIFIYHIYENRIIANLVKTLNPILRSSRDGKKKVSYYLK